MLAVLCAGCTDREQTVAITSRVCRVEALKMGGSAFWEMVRMFRTGSGRWGPGAEFAHPSRHEKGGDLPRCGQGDAVLNRFPHHG
jgi:hypothetical protein